MRRLLHNKEYHLQSGYARAHHKRPVATSGAQHVCRHSPEWNRQRREPWWDIDSYRLFQSDRLSCTWGASRRDAARGGKLLGSKWLKQLSLGFSRCLVAHPSMAQIHFLCRFEGTTWGRARNWLGNQASYDAFKSSNRWRNSIMRGSGPTRIDECWESWKATVINAAPAWVLLAYWLAVGLPARFSQRITSVLPKPEYRSYCVSSYDDAFLRTSSAVFPARASWRCRFCLEIVRAFFTDG